MLTSSRPNGRRLLNRSLGLLAAGGMALGMVAMSGGTAHALLWNPDGGVPFFVQGGPASLPNQANSIRVTVPGTSSRCIGRPSDRSANIATGYQMSEGVQFSIDAYSDNACQGNKVLPGIAYTASYTGPDPRNGRFTRVQARVANAAMFVCTDGGWSDGWGAPCRQA
ncbi:hypothetical protein [Streptomyces capitiformicae]|uniref:Uncharacterized protein n=1 Tax=Streptomyces capitiformicae TaxID=2014920 RepID=A0A918Z2C1_9ACTN|nr:hypothetical protein [Streptomyces capitiformicae]GHE33237.1 hypothetical protein GCM10017771_50290 [Streptomyces capitiformicae]